MDRSLWNDKCDYYNTDKCDNLNPNGYNFIVFQLNIRSLLSHQNELKELLNKLENKNSRVDALLLCEMNLNKNTTKLIKIPGFNLESNHRVTNKGGGTAILIREGINYVRRSDLEENADKEIESTYLEIRAKNGKKILMRSFYHSPNVNENKFLQHIRETLPKIQNEMGDKNIILGMDHNLDLLKFHIHQNTQLLIDIMMKNNMHPTITRPTCITNTSATLIDNVFIDDKLFQSFDSCILLEDISDHLPALTLLKQMKILDRRLIEFNSRMLTEDKFNLIRDALHRVDWIELNNTNVNTNFNRFIQIINEKMDAVAPVKLVRISGRRRFVETWMTTGIKESSKNVKNCTKLHYRKMPILNQLNDIKFIGMLLTNLNKRLRMIIIMRDV